MPVLRAPHGSTVDKTGATARAILIGCGKHNQGLQIQLMDRQSSGDGPITGSFMILNAGDNKHMPILEAFVQKATTARELLTALRQEAPSCVHVVNKSHLVLEARVQTQMSKREMVLSNPDY